MIFERNQGIVYRSLKFHVNSRYIDSNSSRALIVKLFMSFCVFCAVRLLIHFLQKWQHHPIVLTDQC